MSFLVLLIAHFLGDFILQSSIMAEKKKTNLRHFLWHCLIYSVLVLFALIWFGPLKNVVPAALIIILAHLVIDYGHDKALSRLPSLSEKHPAAEFILFIADQFLHIGIIFFCARLLPNLNGLANFFLNGTWANISQTELYNGTVLVLLYILCLSPAAILIKKIFAIFSFQNEEEMNDLIKSGYLIGVLERIIILTLWLNGQIGTIGFILAAKSLARFNQLNERNFAEKYLVGTLLSVAIALFCISFGKLILI